MPSLTNALPTWRPSRTAATSFATLDDGSADGACLPGVIGTYLHGALEDGAVCEEIFGVRLSDAAAKAEHYRQLAAWLEGHGRGLERLGFD